MKMEHYHWHIVNEKAAEVTPRQLAESLRYLICDSAYNPDLQRPNCSSSVCGLYQEALIQKYSSVICQENEKGLNNYADVILPLIANARNESEEWSSSLTMDWVRSEQLLPDCTSELVQDDTEKVVFPPATFPSKLPPTCCKPSPTPDLHKSTFMVQGGSSRELHVEKPFNRQSSVSSKACTDNGDSLEAFRTAKEQLAINNALKNKQSIQLNSIGQSKKSLGPSRRGLGNFVSPLRTEDDDCRSASTSAPQTSRNASVKAESEISLPPELSHLDPKLVEMILNEIMESGPPLTYDDIAGLEFAKKTINEIIVLPMLRPDIFTGLRGPPKGLLLFGPPGTGKTLIGKCVASQSKCTFFSISASSLTSKWVGEGEKMVRALFAVARYKQPSVVFIDEVDSLLTQRSESEHESTRRIKTEFLVQMDGVGSSSEDRLLLIGATNRPQELDEAARRRFVKRLYIPLPEPAARQRIVEHLLCSQRCSLMPKELQQVVDLSEGYSGADMTNLCKEAALGPVREIPYDQIEKVTLDQVRPINLTDFFQAFKQVRASVSPDDLHLYLKWNSQFGSWEIPKVK